MIHDTEALRSRLLALRAEVDSVLAALPAAAIVPTSATAEPAWMKIGDYATARSLGYRTLMDMIVEGLPTVGEGRRRRIVVAEADAWQKLAKAQRIIARREEAAHG